MEPAAFRGFIPVFAFQLLVAAYVYFDAHRRDLKNPPVYSYAASIPLVGILAAGAYLHGREDLPEWSEEETAAGSEDRVSMGTEIACILGMIALFVGIRMI